jgi:shikimate kinase
MGSGKSFWGKKMSQVLNYPFIDLDEYIIKKENEPIQTLFNEFGETYFRMLENKYFTECIENNTHFIMSCGGGTPCFKNNLWLMKKNGVSIYLKASIETLVSRLITEQENRPLLENFDKVELTQYVLAQLNERNIIYNQADYIVDINDSTEEELLKTLTTLCINPPL